MKYLVDEQISGGVAKAMSALGAAADEEWVHIRDDLGRGGAQDPEIPPLCKAHDVTVLVTMNVRDFGARKHYFASLLEHGVHVVVVRPGRQQPDPAQQLGLIATVHSQTRRHLLSAERPSLVVVTHGTSRVRDLEQLLQEITGLP